MRARGALLVLVLACAVGAQPPLGVFAFRASVLESDASLDDTARAKLEADLAKLLLPCGPFEDGGQVVGEVRWNLVLELEPAGLVTRVSVAPPKGLKTMALLPPWHGCVTNSLERAQVQRGATRVRVAIVPLDPRAPPIEPRPKSAAAQVRAAVTVTVAEQTGALTEAEVEGVLAKQRAALVRLFESSAAGEVAYVLETDPRGRVVKARLDGPVGPESARGLGQIRRWVFPAHELPSTVRLLVQVGHRDSGSH